MSSKSQSLKDNLNQLQSELMALHLQPATPAGMTLNAHTPPDISASMLPLSMPPTSSLYVQSSEVRTVTIRERNSTTPKSQ